MLARLYGDNNGIPDMAQYMVHIHSWKFAQDHDYKVRKVQSLSALKFCHFFMN